MKIENQVISLELAKQLKALDVKQDSYWKWENYSKNAYGYVKEWQLTDNSCLGDEINVVGLRDPKDYEIYAAFTVAELGEMLPQGYWESGKVEIDNSYFCSYEYDYEREELEYADTEANARAKMLTYLLSDDCDYDDLKFLKWKNSVLDKRIVVKGIK